ncbi:hypothetical protein LOK49_LG04G00091 [Camellia lanceoleosa]|uniref:Uncharacterized protein n=1 Tax=Camellia lanceoleosa TaxID=1840588 RepID=A0ACC0I6N3_9ERIC|nr:hypothetical protein LOK49_LG04G00091 [Camellia lanceoleosa]
MGPTSYHRVPIILPMEVSMVVKESLSVGSMEGSESVGESSEKGSDYHSLFSYHRLLALAS